jgi:hypothetical protein
VVPQGGSPQEEAVEAQLRRLLGQHFEQHPHGLCCVALLAVAPGRAHLVPTLMRDATAACQGKVRCAALCCALH